MAPQVRHITGSDTAGIARIRRHMRDIAVSFEVWDFTKPFQVHAEVVPGVALITLPGTRE